MEKSKNSKTADNTSAREAFDKATTEDLHSGSLKFPTSYLSTMQLYEAVQTWVKEDPKVLYAVIRNSGEHHAIDFLYDRTDMKYKSLLHNYLKPYFKSVLGDDLLVGWDMANPVTVVKK